MKLQIQNSEYSICRLESSSQLPPWALLGEFYSVVKTSDELSLVCESKNIPEGIKKEEGWKILKVLGPLDFNLTGILSSLTAPLAAEKISLFAISTFDTDYLLVKSENLQKATDTLIAAGFDVLD